MNPISLPLSGEVGSFSISINDSLIYKFHRPETVATSICRPSSSQEARMRGLACRRLLLTLKHPRDRLPISGNLAPRSIVMNLRLTAIVTIMSRMFLGWASFVVAFLFANFN